MADWMANAACLNAPLDDFFPSSDTDMTAVALAMCSRCPVIAECLTHALEHGITDGIWGGMTPQQRRTHPAATGHTSHGTTTGYTTDRCRCQPCRDAIAAHRRGWNSRNKETARG